MSETFLILKRIEPDFTINVHMSSHKVPLLLADFNEIWIPSTDTQISSLFKIPPDGAQLFQSDGQTDMRKLAVALRNFSKAFKIH